MIDTQNLEASTNVEQTTPNTAVVSGIPKPDSLAEGSLRFLVVIAGIILGGIAALIIGLATEWISLAC